MADEPADCRTPLSIGGIAEGIVPVQIPLVLAIFAADDGNVTRQKTVRRGADRLAIAFDPPDRTPQQCHLTEARGRILFTQPC